MKKIILKQIFLVNIVLSKTNIVVGQSLDSLQYLKEYTQLNEALKDPEHVYRLNLSNQTFKEFPSGLSQFKNLQYLSLRNDHLTKISNEIGTLQKLRVLDLGGNDFSLLPKDFVKLENLEVLYLDDDKKLDLYKDFEILALLPKLRVLHLENDGIREVPSNIYSLMHLEDLYLSDNLLRITPPQIKDMKNLKFLELHNNHLPTNLHLNQPYPASGLRIKF